MNEALGKAAEAGARRKAEAEESSLDARVLQLRQQIEEKAEEARRAHVQASAAEGAAATAASVAGEQRARNAAASDDDDDLENLTFTYAQTAARLRRVAAQLRRKAFAADSTLTLLKQTLSFLVHQKSRRQVHGDTSSPPAASAPAPAASSAGESLFCDACDFDEGVLNEEQLASVTEAVEILLRNSKAGNGIAEILIDSDENPGTTPTMSLTLTLPPNPNPNPDPDPTPTLT